MAPPEPDVGEVAVTCPVCRSADSTRVLSLSGLPLSINAQVRPAEAARVARGDMELVVCRRCAHLYNRAFDASRFDYDASYENTLHFSEQFRQHAAALAARLVDTYSLRGAAVAELGSGPGHFLSMLCDAGVGRAVGFDPSYDAGRLGAPSHPSVTVSTEMFPTDGSLAVALAFSQHVLEHLGDPVDALRALRAAVVATAGVVYSEVPNGELMLRHAALWDLIYEHRSYFVPTSLALACGQAGLRVDHMAAAFGDQFLWCDASPSDVADDEPDADTVARGVAAAERFGVIAVERIATAREELVDLASAGPVMLWGAGSKGATYLNLVADSAEIAGVVDINPRKHGWGVPGTSLTIQGPDTVVEVRPRTVLAANPIYVEEISAQLVRLGTPAEVRALWGTT